MSRSVCVFNGNKTIRLCSQILLLDCGLTMHLTVVKVQNMFSLFYTI